MKNEVPILYHYCSVSTFLKIISNAKFHLSDISKSNDWKEATYYCERVMAIFEKAMVEVLRKYSALDEKKKGEIRYQRFWLLFNSFKDNIDLYQIIDNMIKNAFMFFTICFSEDGDCLSQWRGYASDGSGVAIGINPRPLVPLSNQGGYRLKPINYELDNMSSCISNAIVSEFWKLISYEDVHPSDFENVFIHICDKLYSDAIFYKSKSFFEEREWRFIYRFFGEIRNSCMASNPFQSMRQNNFVDYLYEQMQILERKLGFEKSPVKIKLYNDCLVPYVDFDFHRVKSRLIFEIILGPKSKLNEYDVKTLLLKYHYNIETIKISKSKITYR